MSERERVARLSEWLDSIVPLQGQMAEEEDTVEAIDLWLDLKWLRENLLALLAERQEPVKEYGWVLRLFSDRPSNSFGHATALLDPQEDRGDWYQAGLYMSVDEADAARTNNPTWAKLTYEIIPVYLAPQQEQQEPVGWAWWSDEDPTIRLSVNDPRSTANFNFHVAPVYLAPRPSVEREGGVTETCCARCGEAVTKTVYPLCSLCADAILADQEADHE